MVGDENGEKPEITKQRIFVEYVLTCINLSFGLYGDNCTDVMLQFCPVSNIKWVEQVVDTTWLDSERESINGTTFVVRKRPLYPQAQ